MTKKGIIYETLGSTAQMQIVESGNSGEVLLHGVFGVCGIKNGNNRIYEKSNYGKMVNMLQEQMKSEAVLGELEHPNTMNITLENVSHKIEEITMNEDGTVTGTIRLLDTPKGKIAKAIIEGGCPLYISSRGAGSIDESGHVTLTMIKTYDLVGTPGFSQAKLTLKQDQKFEALNESLENPAWMIVESEEPDENDKNGNGDNASDKITMEDIKKSVDELTQKVEKLESELHIAQEAKEAADKALQEAKKAAPVVNYAAIQTWIEEEFAPEFRNGINEAIKEDVKKNITAWVNENYSPRLQSWIKEEFAPQIQAWTINEFGQQVQSWVNEDYSETIQDWVVNHFAPVVENWVNKEYSATMQKWINEEFAPEQAKTITESVNKNVSDFLEAQQKDNKYSAIDDVLEKLSASVNDESVAQKILESQQKDKYANVPVVEGMPMNFRPLWEALDEEKKEAIIRESRMYDMTKPGAVEKFWSTRKLTAETVVESRQQQTPEVKPINEARNNVFKQMKKLQG